MPLIADSSPLILLAKVDRLELLQVAYERVLIPVAVRDEVRAGHAEHPDARAVLTAPWIEVYRVTDVSVLRRWHRRLDLGEAEVIALALELGASMPVLIDDQRGFVVAREHGLAILRTLGFLVVAKSLGLLDRIAPVVTDLRSAGLRVTDDVVAAVLARAGEHKQGQ